MSDTYDRVKKLFAEHLAVPADKVTEEASLQDDLGADSLDMVELCMATEEEFAIQIPDDELESLTLVADWVKFIDKTKAAA